VSIKVKIYILKKPTKTNNLFTRYDRVAPGLGTTNLLLLLLLLFLTVSEFLLTFCQFFDNFITTF
jgi:hypothetical protein